MWQSRNPVGYARLTHAKAAIAECAIANGMPTENLISPEAVRRSCWPTPPESDADRRKFVASELAEFGARPWQIELVLAPIVAILSEREPLIVEVTESEGEEPETPAADSE